MPIYSDLNLHNADKAHGALVIDDAAILQSVENIIENMQGTRMFHPEYNTAIRPLLFRNMDADTEFLIFARIADALRLYEPRITVLESESEILADYTTHSYTVRLAIEFKDSIQTRRLQYTKSLKAL